MAGKIFVNYRRDDERAAAARVRDRLATAFGRANVFMDVDNLVAGQRFDRELEKALAETDVFIAVIGARWMQLLADRQAAGERDYVREEIAGALQRDMVVIPVLIERAPLPRGDALPQDIRALVLHQKHSVEHDQFGRDVASLIEAIRSARKSVRNATGRPEFAARWGWFAVALLLLGIAVAAGGYVFKSVTPLPVATGALERAWGKAKALLGQSKDAAQKGMEAAKPMVDKAKEAVGTAAATAKEAVKKPSRTRDEPSERTRGKPDPPERTREKYDPPLREAPSDGTRGLSPPAAPPGQ